MAKKNNQDSTEKHLDTPVDYVMTPEEILEEATFKHKMVLEKVEKEFEKVKKVLVGYKKFSHKKYKLTDGEIERIVNALRESYVNCTQAYESEVIDQLGLFD